MVGRSSQDADKQLASLLANDHLTAASSGIYVYCHRQNPTPDAVGLMQLLLASAPYPLVAHFLRIAPNMSHERLAELTAALNVVWKRKRWAEQVHIIALLERLAYREPHIVRTFIDDHTVVQFVIASNPNAAAERDLVRSIVVLARTHLDWSIDRLIMLFEGVWQIGRAHV